jgi:hypothetical protein
MRTFPSIEPLMKTLSLTGLKFTQVTASKENQNKVLFSKKKPNNKIQRNTITEKPILPKSFNTLI